MPEIRSVVTQAQDIFHVLFYDIKYVCESVKMFLKTERPVDVVRFMTNKMYTNHKPLAFF